MPRRAVVIGAGLAGMLAAAVLSDVVDDVVVVDRDDLPEGPEHRRGLPQGRHAHLLMAGGLAAMEELMPGGSIRQRLLAAGAREIPLGHGMVALTPEGWLRRWRHDGPRMLSCTRALLDFTVRSTVLAHTGTVIRKAQAVGLVGDARRVRGVRLAAPAAEEVLPADFVVDASGRGTRVVTWLGELGISGVRERGVDAGLVNATRVYRTPAGAEQFPLTMVQADPYAGRPGRSGMVLPIEGDRWMVSLAGSRGGEPPADPDGFLRYALDLPSPLVGRLVSGAEPLTDVYISRSTSNARRYLEKLPRWPEGFVALGDAVATYNPGYGQGMSVAALGARLLRDELRRSGPDAPGLARRVQRDAARPVDAAWAAAVGQDVWYPDSRGARPGAADRLVTVYSRRLTRAATGSYRAAAALWEVTSLRSGPERLLRPDTLLDVLNGPLLPPLSGPPLTPAERKILQELDRTNA
ncbi:pyridine nucleotide-disulfide oxidoreductase [Streptomyces sp. NBC_01788]|uniref:pyridine nucleotide-disulfide oxidoreductase n=1 Tax=unclassified Streptomyces TaxID=2593676 RepID=UPI002DD8260A|nr:pyridine nucleotide-disulfide oxidoreductase [Streptomyces sp. NBC_01788]WSB26609.1 pyridine nucleotide-disulfide oxidoreductase [Streptomyces sp. NBC_01788]